MELSHVILESQRCHTEPQPAISISVVMIHMPLADPTPVCSAILSQRTNATCLFRNSIHILLKSRRPLPLLGISVYGRSKVGSYLGSVADRESQERHMNIRCLDCGYRHLETRIEDTLRAIYAVQSSNTSKGNEVENA